MAEEKKPAPKKAAKKASAPKKVETEVEETVEAPAAEVDKTADAE